MPQMSHTAARRALMGGALAAALAVTESMVASAALVRASGLVTG